MVQNAKVSTTLFWFIREEMSKVEGKDGSSGQHCKTPPIRPRLEVWFFTLFGFVPPADLAVAKPINDHKGHQEQGKSKYGRKWT